MKAIFFLFFIPTILSAQEKLEIETILPQKWVEYSKSFEYEDYENLAKHFVYPTTLHYTKEPLIVNNKEELIKHYKYLRAHMQTGYKYSLLERYNVIQLSENMACIHAFYSRFNSKYERIYTGSGIYSYKKVNGEWKMYALTAVE
jgi:hypothetical protein